MSGVNGNGWIKISLAFGGLVVAGLVAWGTLKSQVADLRTTSAHKDVVAAQFTDITNQLRAMQAQLDRIERKVQ